MSNKNDIITDNNVMIYLREGNEYAFRFIFGNTMISYVWLLTVI